MLVRVIAALVSLALTAPGARAKPPSPEAKARYEAARAYSEARGGLVLLVVEGDAVVYAGGRPPGALRKAHPIYSGVKGLLCPLVIAAEGEVGLDDPTGPVSVAGDEATRVRVRDLLAMTSGLDEARWWQVVEAPGRSRRAVPDDRYAFARTLDVLQPPGSLFQYSGVHAAALGGYLVSRGIDPRRLLTERVFRPLGVRPGRWLSDGAGQPILSHGLSLKAEHWARIGMLMRDDGVYRGERLFPAKKLRSCLEGSPAMPAYGFGWWLNEPVGATELEQIPPPIRDHLATPRPFHPGPPDLFAAIGSQGQRMYVSPSRDLVIVRLARRHPGEPFLDAVFLDIILQSEAEGR